ncbi:hypothetical protein RM553_19435 [Zunongwangia sp. F363]|uniref:Uncharacterized protein n=1 Tax=Autumnicola tepida TaxID=3075595 RepID=A0ABU3CFB5_9FLAO|nr:hypothetical protein [Zunongwangia sp. F363]MDT0645014.1 hypothetical protein [Zunongwangia sp. F363]
MRNSIYISEVIQYGPNLKEDEILGICENISHYYNLKSFKKTDSIKKIAYENEFENLNKGNERIIKMSKSKYIDDFFKNGSLQLGTFKYYQQFDNPEIGDKTEGSFVVVGQNSKSTTFAVVGGGFNNYMFCAYNGAPNPEVINKFGYDDYFEITNIQGFRDAIARKLEATNILSSNCLYRQFKVLVGQTDENFNLQELSNAYNLVNNSKYFIKTTDFDHQNEYRILWNLPTDLEDKLIIKCPEAIQYCKRK